MTTAPVTATGALTGVIPPLLTPLTADGELTSTTYYTKGLLPR